MAIVASTKAVEGLPPSGATSEKERLAPKNRHVLELLPWRSSIGVPLRMQ